MRDYGEPWSSEAQNNQITTVYRNRTDVDDRFRGSSVYVGSVAKEHVDRIVACVNACAGIPNEVLDGFKPGELLDRMTRTAINFLMDQGYMICKDAPVSPIGDTPGEQTDG